MIRIQNFNVPIQEKKSLGDLVAKRLEIKSQDILLIHVVRKAIDARRYRGAPLRFVYILDVSVAVSEKKLLARLRRDKNLSIANNAAQESEFGNTVCQKNSAVPGKQPVVVGFGPAGMFAALTLARHGYNPIVLERGKDVDSRHRDIQSFWQGGSFDGKSNVQFGEGGAGTFSDGKLTTRVNDPLMELVLADFVAAGAPEEIKYLQKPHIGTDLLRQIVKNIRMEIIRLGGQVCFESQVTGIEIASGRLTALQINDNDRLETDAAFFGIGHSSRDTYAMLKQSGLAMEPKPFAIGVRIEHPQEFIDRSQYGNDTGNSLLPVADYALTYNNRETGRGCYSFCMCPGGQVVAAVSEIGGVVTNGMSNYHRDSGIANSALLVTVKTSDFSDDVLGGIEFQRQWERAAFKLGGGNYFAPVQTVGDFLNNRSGSKAFLTVPTYQPGIKVADLHKCLPNFVTSTMAEALPYFDKKINGFANAGTVMTGVETRSSAPCRIIRNKDSWQSESVAGIFPIGEGAGYAGGIMSAALDGLNAARSYCETRQ